MFVLALSPATMTLDRGNIPDSLMILLVVLAADSTVTLILTGRWRSAAMAAVWVGLAFQAKMLEAWLFLPALALAYLVAGPATIAQRFGRIAVMGATVAVISLSYMSFVALTPASQRPYADGSSSNSIYHQVFVYNGFSRVGQVLLPGRVARRHSGHCDLHPGLASSSVEPAAHCVLRARHGLAAARRSHLCDRDRGGAPTSVAH